ncbi:MAG: tRNA preQ1(34) S-adenosylmethionine ribosyltransferase-isomerase QueA [Gammaproteobacteria bacterium]|jgi:S-adenosylmethionine:tRNA ribosyltransferase-isomerase|nr:tRNA preQ1(34) S-adenosylmethionine ribosyltransferase-isomerase QueA [Gammaproteobacteria bacterium]
MKKTTFRYELPNELIAQYPAQSRSASRLLALDGSSGDIQDLRFVDLTKMLHPGDLLVFNNTRVIPARLFATKDTGGRVEILVERILGERNIVAQLGVSKRPRPGMRLRIDEAVSVDVVSRRGDFYELRFECTETVTHLLERVGHVPLPPYIDRVDKEHDRERYQTVYAQHPGAVAAPTAGLHFDVAMFGQLRELGVDTAFLTLHVGAGTFKPIRVEDIREHEIHPEYLQIGSDVCVRIETTKARGGRIIAVGTTVVRALETAAQNARVIPFEGETGLYILPGYRFQIVDALLTNFHLPESTLLVLVCAFAGTEHTLNAYRHAVDQRYRFYSYGDAMFVTPRVASGK